MTATAFSFSAPQITEEDEEQEIKALTDEERLHIDNDLHGRTDERFQEETQEMRESASALLKSALMQIPVEDKAAYLEALELSPALVETETPSLAFMRADDFQAEASARRLVLYWKFRRSFFGPEKAFLPMTLQGAMLDDREIIEDGIIYPLTDDEHGRMVLYVDRSRMCEPYATREQLFRLIFYMHHVICQSETLQKHGYVAIVNFEGFDMYKHMDRIRVKKMVPLVLRAMPLKVRAIHLFCGRSSMLVLGLALPFFKFLMGKFIRMRLVIHGGYQHDYAPSTLEFGITRLSHDLGGDYGREEYDSWLAEREVLEKNGVPIQIIQTNDVSECH